MLTGTPVLEEILSETKILRSNVAGAIHVYLKPLVAMDVAAFISRQVQHDVDGPIMDSLVSPPIIERINDYTGGSPRLINMLCEHALLIAKVREQVTLSTEIVDEAASELSLKGRQIDLSPEIDFDSLEITHSGSATQSAMVEQLLAHVDIMNNETTHSGSATQSAKTERWLAHDGLMHDSTRSLAIRPLSASESEWRDDRQVGKGHSRRLNFSGLPVALLAGLFGGIGVSIFISVLSPNSNHWRQCWRQWV